MARGRLTVTEVLKALAAAKGRSIVNPRRQLSYGWFKRLVAELAEALPENERNLVLERIGARRS